MNKDNANGIVFLGLLQTALSEGFVDEENKNTNICPHCGSQIKKVHKVKISGVRWKK